MNRRTVLTAALSAPAVALAGPLPVAAVVETPVMALFRRHRDLWNAMQAHPVLDDAEMDRLFFDELYQIEDQMFALASQTPGDMAAKMIVAHGHSGMNSCLDFDGSYWAEARALVA